MDTRVVVEIFLRRQYGVDQAGISDQGVTLPAAPVSASAGLPLCFGNSWGYVACAPRWIADNIAAAGNYYGVSYYPLCG